MKPCEGLGDLQAPSTKDPTGSRTHREAHVVEAASSATLDRRSYNNLYRLVERAPSSTNNTVSSEIIVFSHLLLAMNWPSKA